jgi:predicted nucleic acid-binding protein
VTQFVDAAVLMYAAGADHPYRSSCRAIVEAIRDGEVDATTSVEVIQELIHRFVSIGRPDVARDLSKEALDLFAPVVPITHAVMRRVPDLVARYPTLDARDLVHVATCIHEGINEIISADRGYDPVTEVRRIDPLAFVA